MNYLIDFCCICLSKERNLQKISNKDEDALTYYFKLTSSLPEMCFKEMNNQRLICTECCDNIDTVYKFRKKCLKNKVVLITYISKLECRLNGGLNINENIEVKEECIEEEMEERIEENSNIFAESLPVLKNEIGENEKETMDTDEDNSDFGETEEIADSASAATYNLLSVKSRQIYDGAYNRFREWCKQNKTKTYTENVLLAYFSEKAKDLKSSTLWAQYSMVRTCLMLNDNINISKYPKLMAFLKKNSDGYRVNKSKILTRRDIEKFLLEANNEQYLMIKVVLILGISGACHGNELTNLMIDDIEDVGSTLIVKIPNKKKKIHRIFVVTDDEENILNMLDAYRKYVALRPPQTKHRRFFINYKAGKCSTQVVGKNTFGKIPSQIAMYLDLPNPSSYTGHCFRRTSAHIKHHGGWQSTAAAERYIENSLQNKTNIENQLVLGASTSTN